MTLSTAKVSEQVYRKCPYDITTFNPLHWPQVPKNYAA